MIEAETDNQPNVAEVPSSQPGRADDGLNNLTDTEDAALEAGKIVGSDEVPTKLDPTYIEDTLSAHFKHYEEGAGEAHQRLYRLLGWVFEWGPELKRDARLEAAIRARIEERHKVKPKPEKSGDELLLMLTVGFGKIANVTRSQWNKALLAAGQNGVPRNGSELVEWLEGAGGVKAAGALYMPDGEAKSPSFNLGDYLDSLTEKPDCLSIDFSHTGAALPQGDQILIARSSGQDGEIEILGAVNDPNTVELVAKRHKAEATKVEKLLWDANRYALRAAGNGLAGKMTANDPSAFAKAINTLIDNPWMKQRFFDEDVVLLDIPSETLASDRFQLINPNFNIHDPGRYVKGAKEGSLLPYTPDRTAWGKLSCLEQLQSATRGYLNRHLKKPVPDEHDPQLQKLIETEKQRQAEEERVDREQASVKQLENV